MNLRATLLLIPLLAAVIPAPEAAAVQDLLDIKALSLVPVGPVFPAAVWGQPTSPSHPLTWSGSRLILVEGESIGLNCAWSVNLLNPDDFWEMSTPWNNTWPGHFEDNGVPFFPFTVAIPYWTRLGTLTVESGLGTPCFPNMWNTCTSSTTVHYAKSIPGSHTTWHGPGTGFQAKGAGLHRIRCVLDKPKSFSDRNPDNNVADFVIKVIKFKKRVY
jgi:hypothetical protein